MARATTRSKVLTANFYATITGTMPMREWLLGLSEEDRVEIGSDIANIEYNWPIGPPQCKPLEKGVFEIRSRISDGRSARVLFFAEQAHLFLLHGFIEKTQKTPRRDLDLAIQRMDEMRGG